MHRTKVLLTLLATAILAVSIVGQSGYRPNANASGGVFRSPLAYREEWVYSLPSET